LAVKKIVYISKKYKRKHLHHRHHPHSFDDSTLRSPAGFVSYVPFFHYPGGQPSSNQLQYSPVFDHLSYQFHQDGVVYFVDLGPPPAALPGGKPAIQCGLQYSRRVLWAAEVNILFDVVAHIGNHLKDSLFADPFHKVRASRGFFLPVRPMMTRRKYRSPLVQAEAGHLRIHSPQPIKRPAS